MITISDNAREIVSHLDKLPARMLRRIARALDAANQLVLVHIQRERMSGKGPFPVEQHRLGVRDNRLRGSLRGVPAFVIGQSVVSAIGSNVKYAGAHEFGVTTKPHVIRAAPGSALKFTFGGKTILRKSVKHPGSKIPPRAPIQTGIQDKAELYAQMISQAIIDAWVQQQGKG